tara:strand:+ start:6993 stop:7418 length:426 start_codon:yes stop_codon:yes gene_type:complete
MTISTLAVYDINSFLAADSSLQTIAGKTMNFYPIVGYGEDTPPFVVYYVNPAVPSLESHWNRYDNIIYSIYDSDIDRLLKITERFIYLLGRADTVSESGGVTGTDTRIFSSFLTDSSLEEAIEKDGWFKMDLSFTVYYVAS